MPYYVCALPNKKGDGVPQEFISDDPAKIEEWAKLHDKPGWGVFDCHNPLKSGATRRTKETIGAIECIYADVDPKNIVETMEEVDARLPDFLIPLEIRDSGRGRHIGSKLKEPIDPNDAEMVARVDAVRQKLTEILCGDPQVCHQAALRRRPGTHNTKDGGWAECKVLINEGIEHDLTEWEEALALYDRALFTPKPPAVGENVEYIDFGAGGASKPAIDVDARLAAMRYQGPGNTGINITWWECMGSLLRHDVSVNDTIGRLYAAAQANCQDDPAKENWMRTLAGMAERWLKHEPQFLVARDNGLYKAWQAVVAAKKTPRLIWRQDLGLQVRGYATAEPQTLSSAATGTGGGDATVTPLPQPKYRFKLTSFNDMRPGVEPLYLVDELLPIAGLVDIWGAAKSFKSFWTLDVMFHVAVGWEYRDRYVHQGTVVYCAFEGAHGYKKRIEALRRHYELDPAVHVPLYIMPGQANLITEHKLLIQELQAQLGEERPAVVVLDTLNKSLMGSESKDTDMSAYVRAAEAIRDAFKCVVIIVHHCGLDETRPRGHTSLPGAVDAQLAVVRNGDIVTVTVEMMRDGPEDTAVASKVKTVEVGTDENGKVLTSLVVTPGETPLGKAPRWSKSLALFRRALDEVLSTAPAPYQIPDGPLVSAADVEDVRKAFYAIYIAKDADPKQQQMARRQAFHRAVDKAQAATLIGVRVTDARSLIWLTEVQPGAAATSLGASVT
jgi:AAA domain